MSELTEDQKLVKLGLRSPNQTEPANTDIIDTLQTNIAEDWDQFQTDFDNANGSSLSDLTSWSDFETWLVDNGIGSTEASNIRSTLEGKYGSWSDFDDKIVNQYTEWADFENDFAANSSLRSTRVTDSGLSAAGVRVYEEDGVGRSGQEIPAGGVELFGTEVHFSETSNLQDTKDDASGTDDPVEWSNLSISDTTPDFNQTIDISADVTNNTPFVGTVTASLIVDDEVKDKKTDSIDGNQTKSFTFTKNVSSLVPQPGNYDVAISKTTAQTIEVGFGGLP